ncbi:helix-turn-helix domain-containing protein [Leptospira ellisii]|uniref:Helix-turn-helix domain-containing protein n=1 Tax=Leptospira ellisii TaxID=2023197 RepID=A0A2N0B671_9LEPT|nr:helix-turn-helix domain-containing protein [Leptospira ellisii]MDV6234096.1 helix-turn-helix domain-containing protein [Leptospira ellisii]PJZ92049.1 hypothetical protein CH379_15340 [Leptospira ellisii]
MDFAPVRHDWISKKENSEYSVIPDEYCVLGVQVRGRIEIFRGNSFQTLNPSGITGIMTRAKTFRSEKDTTSFLIRVPPILLAKYLNVPMSEIVNESLSLEDIFPKNAVHNLREDCISEYEEGKKPGWAWDRFRSELKLYKSEPESIRESMRRIRSQNGETSISSLASDLGISQSKLEKDYKLFLGLSPKEYAGLIRFRKTIDLKAESPNLTDLAYRSGYYDQAHFIREFKKRTGKSPKRWFRIEAEIATKDSF